MSAEKLIERLRAKDVKWQKLCDGWIADAEANGQDISASIDTIRRTIEREAADRIATLEAALEEAKKALEPFGRNVDALSLSRIYAHLTREHALAARAASGAI